MKRKIKKETGVSEKNTGDKVKWKCKPWVADLKFMGEKAKEKKIMSIKVLNVILHLYKIEYYINYYQMGITNTLYSDD